MRYEKCITPFKEICEQIKTLKRLPRHNETTGERNLPYSTVSRPIHQMEKAPEQKIGKGMLTIMWIIVLVGLSAYFGSREYQKYNPNQSLSTSGKGEVTLLRNRYNHYVASGFINGKPVVFLLDTGATDVAVPAHLARRLGLQPGIRRQALTANGIVEVRDTTLDSLQLGSITLADVRASINPGMLGDEILLGMSALKDLDFTQSGAKLTLRQNLD